MALLETAEGSAKGVRQVVQDLITPDLRELKADMKNVKERLDRMDARTDRLEQMITSNFEALRRQLDTYNEVQVLKERMARMEGERGIKPIA